MTQRYTRSVSKVLAICFKEIISLTFRHIVVSFKVLPIRHNTLVPPPSIAGSTLALKQQCSFLLNCSPSPETPKRQFAYGEQNKSHGATSSKQGKFSSSLHTRQWTQPHANVAHLLCAQQDWIADSHSCALSSLAMLHGADWLSCSDSTEIQTTF